MILAALALLAAPQDSGTALDAERAFAADAQKEGQWTAFRKWAAEDATMFVPRPVKAQDWLKDRKDSAKAVEWWPTASYVSCDGATAVNTGGWKRPDGSVGYFTTVWQRQPDGGWKWLVDHGDVLAKSRPVPTSPEVKRASCSGRLPAQIDPSAWAQGPAGETRSSATGSARDGTLDWVWVTWPSGVRRLSVRLWDGRAPVRVIADDVAASE